MKSVLSQSLSADPTNSHLSNHKVELSKYRLSKSDKKSSTNPTQNQSAQRSSQSIAKSNKFSSPERRPPGAKENKLSAQKLSFSTFFNTTEALNAQTPNLQRTSSLSEQEKEDISNYKKVRETMLPKKTPKKDNLKKDLRKNKTKSPYSQIDFSDTRAFSDEKCRDLTTQYKFHHDMSLREENLMNSRNAECTLITSYMTTLADDDGSSLTREQKEDLSEEAKEVHDLDNKTGMDNLTNENVELKKKIAELEQKNLKWEAFAKIVLTCHDVVKNEWSEYKKQNEIDKKTIASLKEQVHFLRISKNKALQQNDVRSPTKSDPKGLNLENKLKTLQNENKKLQEDLTFIKEENKILRQSQENIEKYKDATEHYRQIAEDKFKECSSLAEEIICLRTDLDRLNLKYLQTQRELQGPKISQSLSKSGIQLTNNSSPRNTKSDKSKLLEKKRTLGRQTKVMETGSRQMKKVTIIAPKQKHEGNWDAYDEIETPSPVAFGIMPVC